jgi:Zn-dependent protease
MNFLAGAFRIGRLFDINIHIHFLFLVFVAWRLLDSGSNWPATALFLAMLFGIVLIHEFGHCFGARSVGGDAENIMMWPLGGLAYAHAPMRPWPQFITVAAGPLVNLVFVLISGPIVALYLGTIDPLLVNPFGGIYLLPMNHWIIAIWIFYQVNLLLLAFNLLPIYPLDGGQLFHAIIWPFVGLQRASIVASQVGLVGCGLLAIWGLSGSGGQMLIFIAIFGGFTCWQRYQAARQGWLVEDPVFTPTYDHRSGAGGGFFARIFKRRGGGRRTVRRPVEHNPNPGGWEARQQERASEEAELDRLLRKVSEEGIQSLSYVERQKLERITRQRQREEERHLR